MNEQKKILLAEDDLSLLKIYGNKLRLNGFSVSLATTGDEALRKAVTDRPNLILLDLILPNQDGFIVLEQLKKNPATRSVPVIILSNLGQPGDIERGRTLGAADYLIKSDVSLAEIVQKVKKYLP